MFVFYPFYFRNCKLVVSRIYEHTNKVKKPPNQVSNIVVSAQKRVKNDFDLFSHTIHLKLYLFLNSLFLVSHQVANDPTKCV